MLTDSHTHITDVRVLDVMKNFNVYALVCAMDPAQCVQVREWSKIHPHVIPTYGIHPWNADKFSAADIMEYLEETTVIGEIGMDKKWCEVPLDIQRKVFIEQLEIAERRRVPVILHTKAQEKEIVDIISNYTMPKLVHWYHCKHWLEDYLKQDCYFTIGPDAYRHKPIQDMAKVVPIERLLVETDGIDSIAWARKEESAAPEEVPKQLMATLKLVADLRGIDAEELRIQVNKNFTTFCGHKLPE
jgi:TatD DNase family protein